MPGETCDHLWSPPAATGRYCMLCDAKMLGSDPSKSTSSRMEVVQPAPAEMPGEIEHDPHDHSREYIPLPGGWEVQTKGAGSSYRLLDKKTGERHLILEGKDWRGLQAFFTRFAHDVFAASRDERRTLEARALAAEAALAKMEGTLARYIELVGETEGTDFIDSPGYNGPDEATLYRCSGRDERGEFTEASRAIAAAIRAQGE